MHNIAFFTRFRCVCARVCAFFVFSRSVSSFFFGCAALWSNDIFHNYILWILFIIFRAHLVREPMSTITTTASSAAAALFLHPLICSTRRIYCIDKRHTHFSFDIIHRAKKAKACDSCCWKPHMRKTTTISIEACFCHSVWLIVFTCSFFSMFFWYYLQSWTITSANRINEPFFPSQINLKRWRVIRFPYSERNISLDWHWNWLDFWNAHVFPSICFFFHLIK